MNLIDLYQAGRQKNLNWERLFLQAAEDQLNDYNPIEMFESLDQLAKRMDEPEFLQELPCVKPPPMADLRLFVQQLQAVNQVVARQITGT